MGNQREIMQVSPREGPGAVIQVRPSHSHALQLLVDDAPRCYTLFLPAGKPMHFPNLDGPDVSLNSSRNDHLGIQSGGKMWCGYDIFVDHVRSLAIHLEDALFYIGDEEDYIDEFHIFAGELRYRRVHQGGWIPLEEFLRNFMA